MYKTTISVVGEMKKRIEFEKRLESLSKKWKYSVAFYKASNNSDGKYQTVAMLEYPDPIIPEIIVLIQKSDLIKVWYEFRDENGSVGAKEFLLGSEEYSMYGSMEDSKNGAINDVYLKECREFSIKCKERTDDIVIDITEDQQLHIRVFEANEVKLAIDGIIEKDNRTEKGHYWLF